MAKHRDNVIKKVREMFTLYINPTTFRADVFDDMQSIEQDVLINWMVNAPQSGIHMEGFLGHSAVVIECNVFTSHVELMPSFKSDYKYIKNLMLEYYPDILAQIVVG